MAVRRITHIDPMQLGLMLAAIYALLAIIIAAVVIVFSSVIGGLVPHARGTGSGMFGAVGMAVLMVILYPLFGFVGGVIGAWIYNVVASRLGGIQVTVDDAIEA